MVGAVEVRATHAVDEQKRGDLAEMGVEWVEVLADGRMLEPGWTVEELLRVEAASFAWRCDSCRDAERRREQFKRAQEESERSRIAQENSFIEMCVAKAATARQDGLVAAWTRTLVLRYGHGRRRRPDYVHFVLAIRMSGGLDTSVVLYRIRKVKRPLFTIRFPLPEPRRIQERANDALRAFVRGRRAASVEDWGSWCADCMRKITIEEVRGLVSLGFARWCERQRFLVSRVGYHVAFAAYEETLKRKSRW